MAVLNPISWFDSVVWGQVDAFGVVFLLLALRSLWRDQPERAAIFTVDRRDHQAAAGDPRPARRGGHDPAGVVAHPTGRRRCWLTRPRRGSGAAGLLDRIRAWERRTGSPLRILTTGLAGYLTAVIICLPFGLSVIEFSAQAPFIHSGLVDQIIVAGGGYPYLTVNAYNAWAVVPGDTGASLANAGLWVCDAIQDPIERCGSGIAVFGAVPAVLVGAVLLVATIVGVLWVAARRPDRLTLLVALAVLALAFFAVPTRVHERYAFPFFAIGAILFAVSSRWRIAYVVLSIATFANMYVVLTSLYPDNPSISDWLGIGEFIRSQAGVTLFAIMNTAAFLWAVAQLRSSAHERLVTDLADASLEPAGPTVDAVLPSRPAGTTGTRPRDP